MAFQIGAGSGTPGLQMEPPQMDTWHFHTWLQMGCLQIVPWRRDVEGFHTRSDGVFERFPRRLSYVFAECNSQPRLVRGLYNANIYSFFLIYTIYVK